MKKYKPIIRLHNTYLLQYGFFELFLAALGGYMLLIAGMNVYWAFGFATCIALIGGLRIVQYMERTAFIHGLADNKLSKISLETIKKIKEKANKDDGLYLGEGFLWQAQHCQAFHEIKYLQNKGDYFTELSDAGGASYIHNMNASKDTQQIHKCPEHTAIVGTTGIGKTRLMELLVGQRVMQGQIVIVIDPKGDRDLLDAIFQVSKEANREADFTFFSLAHPQHSVQINPLANWATAGEAAARITSIMPQTTASLPFTTFAYDVLAVVIQVARIVEKPITIKTLYNYIFVDKKDFYDSAIKFHEALPEGDKKTQLGDVLNNLKTQTEHNSDHFSKMIGSLKTVLSSLSTENVSFLLSPENGKGLTWNDIITKKKIVYLSLNSMIDANLAAFVGKLIVQDLVSYIGTQYAFSKETPPLINLFVDEFYSVAYEGYVDILNKSRAAGLRVTLGMQTGADIVAKISEPVRQQIYGNTTNKIFLRVLDFAQAKELVEGLGQCQIPKITCMRSVSANQNMDQIGKLFSSGYTERLDMMEVELLPPEILMALPKGQAILVTEGNPPFKLRIPLLDKDASIEKESYFNRLLSQYEDDTTVRAVPSVHVRIHDQGKEEYERNA